MELSMDCTTEPDGTLWVLGNMHVLAASSVWFANATTGEGFAEYFDSDNQSGHH